MPGPQDGLASAITVPFSAECYQSGDGGENGLNGRNRAEEGDDQACLGQEGMVTASAAGF